MYKNFSLENKLNFHEHNNTITNLKETQAMLLQDVAKNNPLQSLQFFCNKCIFHDDTFTIHNIIYIPSSILIAFYQLNLR